MKQRLFLVTGKGGVGKSTMAMALAQQLAEEGKKTLLAELGEHSYFEYALGLRSSYEPIQISKNLDFSLWSGESCLREYVRHLVPVRAVADLFFDNKIMRSFVRAAPGLKELALLGKLTSGIRQWGPKFEYESVVVDAYASGHFLALLNAPKGLGELIETGPMGEQSRSIFKVLSDPEYTEYVLVSLPEELPVSETLELRKELLKLTQIEPKVLLNKYYEFNEPGLETAQIPIAQYISRLNQRSKKSLADLKTESQHVSTLNFIKEAGADAVISQLKNEVGGAF